jgi:hypothetical protein
MTSGRDQVSRHAARPTGMPAIGGHVPSRCGKIRGTRRSQRLVRGADVGHEHLPSADARSRVETHLPPVLNRLRPALITYCVVSGTVAVIIGAAVSLVAPGPQRLALWAVVTAAVAVVAGVAGESRWLNWCRLACGGLLRRLVKPSSSLSGTLPVRQ